VVAVRFAVRKVLLGGATMGAVALAAASTAWACSPSAPGTSSLRMLDTPGTPPGPGPVGVAGGGQVEVAGHGFDVALGTIEIRWNTTGGTLLGTATTSTFSVLVTVPHKDPGDYFIAVLQRKDGALRQQPALPIAVLPQPSSPAPVDPLPGGESAPVVPAPSEQPPRPTDPQPVPFIPANVPAAQPVPRGVQTLVPSEPRPQLAGAPAGSRPAESQVAVLPAVPPPADPTSPTETGFVDDGLPLTIEGLWSGLDDGGAPTLDTSLAGPKQGAGGPSPVGIGFVLAGLLGLGAGAFSVLSAGRRAVLARSR
jgi:hypothetical protein